MKKILAFTLLILVFTVTATAQKPTIDPKNINTPGQKTILPGQLKISPPLEKVSFCAVISERRSATTPLAHFNQIQWNDGNGFNAETGVFTAPVQGVYCMIGNFSIGKYGCLATPITYSISIMKNDLQGVGSFNLPVSFGGPDQSTTEGFTVLVQLNLNDRIILRPVALACDGGQPPVIHHVVFSGYKVY